MRTAAHGQHRQPSTVATQVEFYFSDSNLPRDKFLNEKVAADPDGFVDIALLCTFSRMKALLKVRIKEQLCSHYPPPSNSMQQPSQKTCLQSRCRLWLQCSRALAALR